MNYIWGFFHLSQNIEGVPSKFSLTMGCSGNPLEIGVYWKIETDAYETVGVLGLWEMVDDRLMMMCGQVDFSLWSEDESGGL